MKKIILITQITLIAFFLPLLFGEGWGEVFAQNSKTDSLLTILKTAKHDTTRINTYNELSWEYKSSNPDTALYFANSALKLAIKANYKKGMAASYNNIGNIHYHKGDYDKAIDFYFKSLKIGEAVLNSFQNLTQKLTAKELSEKQSAQKGMANSYNNIGNIHADKGDYDKAIEFYFKSLKIKEELGDKKGMSSSYNNIGLIHANKGDYDKAIDFYFKSLKIYEELGDKKGMSISYTNIGIIHAYKGDYDKAIEFYFKSLKICEELGDKKGMAASYNNIGIIHENKGASQFDKEIQRDEYDKAIDFYFKSLKIREELGDKNGMSTSYTNIGNLYLKQNKPEEAKKQQLLALNIALEIGAKEGMYYAYSSLAQCDSALGNFRGAYEYHKLYSQVHDSVFSKESDDKIAEMGAKYEAEKRELTIQKLEKEKLLQNETLARKEAESKKQRILLFSFLAGFIIILVFSVFLYRLFVQKKMANVVLQQQKEEISTQRDEIEAQRDLVTTQKEHIEEIHKEVTDSINYAKRIQEAVLPVSDIARSVLGEHFILFKPKDIVSGDFYWTTKIVGSWQSAVGSTQSAELLIVVVADCTGHGVPGAFMSMLGISFLNEIVRKQEINKANQVLNELRKEIINALQQKGVHGEQKDGMDISMLVVNTETLDCQWAGANNSLYIVTQFGNENLIQFSNFQIEKFSNCLYELKGDKMPIAIHPVMNDFTNHQFKAEKGDCLYLFSDGFADQFGGLKGKKFMYKQFKELLLTNCQKPMPEQKEILEATIKEWIGSGEQVDDITVLGLKL